MFPIEMTFTVSTPADLAKLVAVVNGSGVAVVAAEVKKSDVVAKTVVDTQTTAATSDAATKTESTADSKVLDYVTDVKPKVIELGKKSRDKVIAVLAEFGAKLGSDITPEQLPAFNARLDTELAA